MPRRLSAPPPATAARKRGRATKIEQRQASIEMLLASALRLFVSRGYRSTNLEQISGAAKLSKGAVYFYFKSKEALLIALLEQVRHIVVDEAINRVNAAATATDQLVAYIHYQANLGITHRDEVLLLILMSLEFKERESAVQDFIGKLHKRQRSFIEKLVRSGQASGAFRTDVPARELASSVLAIHDGTFLEWFRRSGQLKGRDLVRALRSTLLGGITVRRH